MAGQFDNKSFTYNFRLHGEQGDCQVVFRIDDDNIDSACDCNYLSDRRLCWHRYYILAGKQQRIPDEERPDQAQLLAKLSRTAGGRDLMRHARTAFGEKEGCRRCNKTEVIALKRSLIGRVIGLFLPKTRNYFCWSCRWSW